MAGKLIAHSGAQYIDREGLNALETPASTDSWTPIPHYDLVVALEGQLKARGISIVKEQFAIQKAKLFGVIDTDYQVTEEGGAAIGIRTANDKSLALQLAIGYRVFVCDNMSFAGDLIALKRKHTAHLDLHKEFAEGIGRYVRDYRRLQDDIQVWKDTPVTPERAKTLIYDIFLQKIVPVRLFHPVITSYQATLHQGQNLWTLKNAFTRHVQHLNPGPAFSATVKLGKFFERVG
ncbi:MAG TPA: DUF932 domain-containing protein [Candidatus Saccharimonadia bacterium]|nr:DUF932 domain-containing protein [Candidatus Saccharimonadia bacterium]